YAGGVIKELFPRLYALELHRHATIRMKLMPPSLDNSFRRRVRSGAEESQFNSLLEIVQVINLVPCEDRYFWWLESEGDYPVASIRKLIDEKRFQEADLNKEQEQRLTLQMNDVATISSKITALLGGEESKTTRFLKDQICHQDV
nr:RNA-directed DNA polymerase, eukaryota [Tanacetum cinerariifolium]